MIEPQGLLAVCVGGASTTACMWAAAMDPWKEFAALENGRDVVRRWAALEGKSRSMSDDLLRASSINQRVKTQGGRWKLALHAGALIVELWRMIRSG